MVKCIIFSIVLLIFSCENITAQAVSIGGTAIYTLTNQKVKMIDSENDFQNTDDAISLSYEHFINSKPYSFFASYIRFKGYTFIKFREGSVLEYGGVPLIGNGFSGVNVSRYDIGMNYNLISNKRKFYIKPFIAFGLQVSKSTNFEYWNDDYDKPNGPEYFQTADMEVDKLNTTQIVPSLGIKTGFIFWKRLDLGLSIQGVYGFKSYQNMYFHYSYKGIPQETAVFQATGTGLFCSLNLGFRFVKLK